MLAGSVYGTGVSGSVVASALQNITPVLVLGSAWSLRSTLKTRAQSKAITEKFMALMAPDLDRQTSVQMEWMESKEKITARGFAEFRDKTTALYQSRVRSLSATSDDRCVFSNPAVAKTGRWFGPCKDGLATGRGYGLARDGDGNSVEFLGEAREGTASGTGAMIVQKTAQEHPIYYEGEFKSGLPDGVIDVERAGEKASLRKFRAGTEVGKATSRQWKRLQF